MGEWKVVDEGNLKVMQLSFFISRRLNTWEPGRELVNLQEQYQEWTISF